MTIIKARLNDQALSLSASPVVASGGVEEDVVTFEFDSTWAGYVKKAVFYRDESNVYHVDVGSDNTAVIPWEVLQQAGHMYFGVFGTKGSEIKTSTVARYRVENGAITTASELNPTPNIYADIIANTAARHSHSNKTVLDGITAQKVTEWNGKSNFSGSYNDLTDKPTIPTEVTPLIGTTSDLTPTQVYNAVSAGIPVKVQYTDRTYGLLSFTAFNVAETLNVIVSQTIVYANGGYILAELIGNKSNNIWSAMFTTLAQKKDIPSSLKNPKALTIKIGSTTVTYDGSAAKTVTIADGTEVSY